MTEIQNPKQFAFDLIWDFFQGSKGVSLSSKLAALAADSRAEQPTAEFRRMESFREIVFLKQT